jgi:mRNA-degrading endonuclease toxin of MazEF toxin-antitoxin module
VTLERRMLRRRLGKLSDQLIEHLDQVLRQAFQLDSDSAKAAMAD